MSIASSVRRIGFVRSVVVACTLVAAAGTCVAQQQEEQGSGLTGSFSKPLGSSGAGQGQTVVSRTVIAESDGDDSYTLTMSGDTVKVEHNGKKVPSDRVVVKNGVVQVLDKDGGVQHEFNVSKAGAGAPAVPAMPRVPRAVRQGDRIATVAGDPPAVMVGMMMEFSEDEEGLIVQRVFDGLPAAESGLQADDVIVEIEGKRVENNESLRDALRSKKPGDSLAINISRDGEKKSLTIKLAKYDQEAMDKARGEQGTITINGLDAFGGPGGMSWPGGLKGLNLLEDDDMREQVRKSVERAIEQVRSGSAQEAERWKGEVIKTLEEALKSVEKSSAQLRGQMNSWRAPGSGSPIGGGRTMIFREMPDQVFEVPPVPPTPGAASVNTDHIEKLSKALERLNDRLDQLEKKLGEKK